MRMTSKGQVTIPKRIRERLGLEPGDEVAFTETSTAVVIARGESTETQEQKRQRILEVISAVRGTGDCRMRTEDFMKLIRPSDIPGSMGFVGSDDSTD